MLNGIPFRSASGIVSDSDSKVKAVSELRLEFGFPSPPATAFLPPVSARISSWRE